MRCRIWAKPVLSALVVEDFVFSGATVLRWL